MTGAKLAALIRYKTKTNSTTFTDADMLPLVNTFKDEIASQIVERNAGYFQVPIVFDLVANVREYGWPDDLLNRMAKLELKFNTADTVRYPATYVKDYRGSEAESDITGRYYNSQGGFAYTIRRRAVFILSGTIPAVTGGGRLLYYAFPVDLTVLNGTTDLSVDPSTTTFGFPRQFHELLARRVSIEFKSAQPKPLPLSRHELNYENDLKLALDAIAHVDESAEIIGDSLSAQDTGDNGFNY